MRPPPLSWWRLVTWLVPELITGMLWLVGAGGRGGGAGLRSSSESLLLELSSLLEDDELLEFEELSLLLIWSMTRASAISSAETRRKLKREMRSRKLGNILLCMWTFHWSSLARHLFQCHPLETLETFSPWEESSWSWLRSYCCRFPSSAGSDGLFAALAESEFYCCLQLWKAKWRQTKIVPFLHIPNHKYHNSKKTLPSRKALVVKHTHSYFSLPCFLDSYVAVEFFEPVLSCVMVHDEDALLHVRSLRSLEHCDWSTWTLTG